MELILNTEQKFEHCWEGDFGVRMRGKECDLVVARAAFVNSLQPIDDTELLLLYSVEQNEYKIKSSLVVALDPFLPIPSGEYIRLILAPTGDVETRDGIDYKMEITRVAHMFPVDEAETRELKRHKLQSFTNSLEPINDYELDVFQENLITKAPPMENIQDNTAQDYLNVTTTENEVTTNNNLRNFAKEVDGQLLGKLHKYCKTAVLNGVPMRSLERKSAGLKKNLVNLISKNEITDEQAISVLGLFYTNCNSIGEVPTYEQLVGEINSAKNTERLLKEIPDKKVDATNIVSTLREIYGNRIAWNSMTNTIELDGAAPEDENHLYIILGEEHGLKVSRQLALDGFARTARENCYHPIKDYLESLTEKFKEEVTKETAFEKARHILGNLKITDPWEQTVFIRCLIGAVARVHQPGCKVDIMPILHSAQGYGKSTLISILGGEGYIDISGDPGNKDGLMELHRGWIVEIAEVEKFTRTKEAFHTKSIITKRNDLFRPPYGAKVVENLRKFVFMGTTNETDLFLDPTGNRRYVVINITGEIDFDYAEGVRDLLWACVKYLYENGEHWYLTREEARVQAELNKDAVVTDCRIELVENYVTTKTLVTTLNVVEEALGIPPSDSGFKRAQMEVSKMLTQLGYTKKRRTIKGKKLSVWEKDETTEVPSKQPVSAEEKTTEQGERLKGLVNEILTVTKETRDPVLTKIRDTGEELTGGFTLENIPQYYKHLRDTGVSMGLSAEQLQSLDTRLGVSRRGIEARVKSELEKLSTEGDSYNAIPF